MTAQANPKTLLLLKPRGFCAGVVRAIDIVRIALETFGAPIYVRKEIVHNRYVVDELASKGAIFVDSSTKFPRASASSIPLTVFRRQFATRSKARGLRVIDATCPLVTKVHVEAVKFAKQGYSHPAHRTSRPRRSYWHAGRSSECDPGRRIAGRSRSDRRARSRTRSPISRRRRLASTKPDTSSRR